MIKKLISIILMTSFVLSLGTVSYANEISYNNETVDALISNGQIYTLDTVFEGIKQSDDGFYAMEIEALARDDSGFIPVGKLDIDITDESQMEEVLSSDVIPNEIKQEIERKKEIALKSECEDQITMTFFSTELLNSQPNGISPRNTTYKTYNGYEMRSDKLYTYGLDTGYEFVQSGKNTKTEASKIADIVIIVAGVLPFKSVSLTAGGISLFQFFVNANTGITATGHTSDFAQVALIYDVVDQWTYARLNGDWSIGLISQQVKITSVDTRQYYYDINARTGETVNSSYSPNKTFSTKNFSSPWAKALQWAGNPEYEKIEWKLGSATFDF